jgi:GNAT superfamily N-acetyltransferase
MAPTYNLSEALPSDAYKIASLFSLSWKSPLSRLQFGDVEPDALATAMTSRIAQQIEEKSMLFMIACEADTREVASVAQWTAPTCTSTKDAEQQDRETETAQQRADREERETFDDEIYFNSLPPSSNRALILEFTAGLRRLRQRILGSEPHFLLENLATHPEHRGRGLAARLIEHVLVMADERSVVTYLDTAEDNAARRLYERLGFEERGREAIEHLSKFASKEEMKRVGVKEAHTHVGFVRVPKRED